MMMGLGVDGNVMLNAGPGAGAELSQFLMMNGLNGMNVNNVNMSMNPLSQLNGVSGVNEGFGFSNGASSTPSSNSSSNGLGGMGTMLNGVPPSVLNMGPATQSLRNAAAPNSSTNVLFGNTHHGVAVSSAKASAGAASAAPAETDALKVLESLMMENPIFDELSEDSELILDEFLNGTGVDANGVQEMDEAYLNQILNVGL
jgi:hypothetical protein